MSIHTIEECFYQIRNGANIKQGVVDGGYPITRIETTANDKFNRDRMGYAGITDIKKYESYVLEDGDLLMSHINSVQYLGRTVLYEKQGDEKIIHGMNLLGMKANRDILKPAYARYYFYSRPFREQVGKITKKSLNQASFAVADLKKIKMKVPDLAVQEEVVEILNRLNCVIEERQQELQKMDELIKARFVELFGDQTANPYGWQQTSIGACCALKSGTSLPADKENEGGEIPYIKVGDMNYPGNEQYITTSSRFVSKKTAGTGIFPVGTVVFPKRGGAIGTNKKRLTRLPICADLNVMGVTAGTGLTPQYRKRLMTGCHTHIKM